MRRSGLDLSLPLRCSVRHASRRQPSPMADPSPQPTASGTSSDSAFLALGLDAALVSSVTSLGYEEPTDIQREAIPPLIAGSDVLGQAATGTGKTAAFAL